MSLTSGRAWIFVPRFAVHTSAVLMCLAYGCGPQTPAFQSDAQGQNASSASDATSGGKLATTATGGAGGGSGTVSGGSGSGAGSGGASSAAAGAGSGGSAAAMGAGSGAAAVAGSGSGSGGANAGGGEGGVNLNLRVVETTQKGGGKLDILWVIDDSASMSPEQDNLATNFNQFITQLADANLDFQTAVTTTDVCQQSMPADLAQRACPVDNYGGSPATHLRGAFVGSAGRRVLTSHDSDLISLFNTYVRQGTGGSDFEHGLTAAHLAVQASLSGQNQALLRPDAFLAVIVLSDEEDDGIGLGMVDAFNGHNFIADGVTSYRYTSDNMIADLQAAKGMGNFSISGIVGTRDASGKLCSSSVASPHEEGTQYIAAAQKSGGIIRSVCDTNWGSSMTQIGLDLAAQVAQIPLPSVPDQSTIHVTVNGVASSNWSYNSANNAVKFTAGNVPADGAGIKITYADAQH